MEMEATIVKAGSNAVGLKLIGDKFIGYRFVPRCDEAEFADTMLEAACPDIAHLAAWCEANKDGDYSSAEWESKR
jgi:hypothetical protein